MTNYVTRHQSHRFQKHAFDLTAGVPFAPDLFYLCHRCEFLMWSFADECGGCDCRNLVLDVGRFSHGPPESFEVLECLDATWISELCAQRRRHRDQQMTIETRRVEAPGPTTTDLT